jgi:hypothetical protein
MSAFKGTNSEGKITRLPPPLFGEKRERKNFPLLLILLFHHHQMENIFSKTL